MSEKPISPLRQRMIEDMTVRNFIEKTRNDYIRHVLSLTASFAARRIPRHPKTCDASNCIRRKPVCARRASMPRWQAFALARHLTFVREPRKIPAVLSSDEVVHLLEAAPGPKYKV